MLIAVLIIWLSNVPLHIVNFVHEKTYMYIHSYMCTKFLRAGGVNHITISVLKEENIQS